MPNFNFKSQFPIADIVNAIQRKPLMQAQIDQMQEEQKQQRMKSLLDALSTGASVSRTISANKSAAAQTAQTLLQNQQLQQQNQGQADVGNLLQSANGPSAPVQPQSPMAPPLAPGVAGPLPADPNSPAYGTTPDFKNNLQAALLRANPSAMSAAMTQQFAPKSLDQIMAEQVASGQLGLPAAAALKNSFNPSFSVSTDPQTGLRQAVNNKNPTAPPINIDGVGGTAQPGTAPGKQPAAPVPGAPPQPLNPKQIEYIGQASDKYINTPEVKESTQALALIDAVNKALESNNPASLTNLRIAIARTSGVSPGSLTSNEIAGESGSKALGAKTSRYLTQMFSGKLSDTDLKDFKALVADRKAAAQQVLAETLKDHSDAFVAAHTGVTADRAQQIIGLPVRRYLRGYNPGDHTPHPQRTDPAQRFEQLKGSGMSEDAAYKQMAQEGY